MSISKQPAKGTPLSVVAKTPAGNVIVGVTMQAEGEKGVTLRNDISEENREGGKITGRVDWRISDDEFDKVVAFDTANKVAGPDGTPLAADECVINLRAFIPGSRFGPNTSPFVPGGAATVSIRFAKGKNTFGKNSPVVLVLIDQCLFNFADPGLSGKAVRELTIQEAYNELVFRHKQGTIQLIPEPKFGPTCTPIVPNASLPRKKPTLGTDGKPEKDANGATVLEDILGTDGKPVFATIPLVQMAPRVGNVRVLYNGFGTRGHAGSAQVLSNVNPINAAGLVRLILELVSQFPGLSEFHHVGIGRSVVIKSGDCHDWGRAIDFAGVMVPDPAGKTDSGKPVPFFLNVHEDWFGETVPQLTEIGQRPTMKDRLAAWPSITRDLEYRFLSFNLDFNAADPPDEQKRVVNRSLNDKRVAQSLKDAFNKVLKNPKHTDPELDAVRTPLVAERKKYVLFAQEFFQTFFDWASDNYQNTSDTPTQTTPNKPMGQAPQFIMHPDHHASDPGSGGREAHHGHYHIQIGVTHGSNPGEPTFP